MLSLALQILASLCTLIGVGCSIAAQIMYFRRPGARWFGLGFARYYYGELRREKPLVFFGSIGGIGAGILLSMTVGSLVHP